MGKYCQHLLKNFEGQFQSSLSLLFEAELKDISLRDTLEFQRLLEINMLGQLIGLPTLHSISEQLGLSNALQKSKNKLDKSLTLSNIRNIYELFFTQELEHKLSDLSHQDKSVWSKILVTGILDDSVFRQWLRGNLVEVSKAYGRFFSGQYSTAVYGYDVLLMGLHIEGVFYPFAFEFIKKDAQNKSERRSEVAQKLLKKWKKWTQELAEKGIHLPTLQLSVDNGFNDIALADKAQETGFSFISVPQKNHNFMYQEEVLQLGKMIEKHFIPAEKTHLEAQKDLPKEKQKPFELRMRAKYLCKERKVTLLIFRLKGSDKVTAIYSLDKFIFAKTLRRHWFARTYIEQFFKLLKYGLKIQEARTRSKEGFERKLHLFMFLALQCQKLIKQLRKKYSFFEQKGVLYIQRTLANNELLIDLLQTKVRKKYNNNI